jgi:pyridoxal 5'-phosphate synthase glutaminase subunit Pdx2
MSTESLKVGVLALQGAFREHRRMLERLGAEVREVRLPADLAGLSGLIIPGGESTTMGKLMLDYGLRDPVRAFHAAGGAIFGTCAGAILLSREVLGAPPQFGHQPSLSLMDISVQRNAFGRQVDSFQTDLEDRVGGRGRGSAGASERAGGPCAPGTAAGLQLSPGTDAGHPHSPAVSEHDSAGCRTRHGLNRERHVAEDERGTGSFVLSLLQYAGSNPFIHTNSGQGRTHPSFRCSKLLR